MAWFEHASVGIDLASDQLMAKGCGHLGPDISPRAPPSPM